MRLKKRVLSLLLTACLVVGLMPTAAFAAGTDTGKAIQLGTSGISDPTSTQDSSGTYYTPSDYVYFGVNGSDPIKWRVLDADKTNDGTTSGMFLLSEYLLDSGVVFESAWNSDYNDGQTNPNEWQHSDAQNWCNTFATNNNVFSTAEQAAFLGVAKIDAAITVDTGLLYIATWMESSLEVSDKVFFLSARELADHVANYDKTPELIAYYNAADAEVGQNADTWWLRSPNGGDIDQAGVVFTNGEVSSQNVRAAQAARPAFNLNLDSVLFTSAAVGGKSGNGVFAISDSSATEWKLTLLDSSRENFALTGAVKAGDHYTVSYSGAATGANEYISVMIADSTGAYTHYGRVAQLDGTTNGASGTVQFDLSGITIPDGGKLYVFNEQYNGGENDDTKLTDYASPLREVVTYAVNFNKNGGSGEMESAYASGSYPLPANGFTAPTGHIFKGWAASATGAVISDTTYNVTADTTLYAVWGGDVANATIDSISDETYSGSAFEPTVTVKLGDKTLTQGTDYTVSYSDNTNAGTASVTIEGKGNYTGTKTVNFTINPAALSINGATLGSKTYDGTPAVTVESVNFSGLKGNETLTLDTDYTIEAAFDNANAGTGKTANITVTLRATDNANNYTLSDSTYTLTGQTINQNTITAISPEFLAVKNYAKEYHFTLADLLPALTAPAQYGNISYSVVSATNNDGVLATVPAAETITGDSLALNVASVADAGKTAEIVIGITTDNYTVENVTLTVKTVDKFPLSISGITAANREYNGAAYTYSGSPVFTSTSEDKTVTGISFTAEYEGRDDTTYAKSTSAPTAVGKYNLILTVSGDSANTYTGSTTIPFEITKKAITLTADSFTVEQGAALPTPTYKITAGSLASGDSFTAAPILTHATQDAATVGSYDITISGGTITNGGEDRTANYDITYTKGTLRVAVFYTVTVTNGTGGGKYAEGDTVSITTSKSGSYTFSGWSSSDVTFANSSAQSTTFTMPAKNVSVTANWRYTGGGGGYTPPSSSDDSGDDDSGSGNDNSEDNSGTGGGTGENINPTVITVPISGTENTIHEEVTIDGKKATITDVDFSDLHTVIGDHVETGVITIDFSVLDIELDTVEIPTDVVKEIAEAANDPDNDAESLEIVFTDGTSIEFDAKALGEKSRQAGGFDITISIKHTEDSSLNRSQREAVGDRIAYHINVTSGGKQISDMGGKVSVHAPYELRPGEKGSGLIVYYVDDNGNKEACETSYDSVRKRVNWKTDHLSVYMIGYDEGNVNPDTGAGNPFTDVSETDWFFEDVMFVYDNGLMVGTSDTTFSPYGDTSRAMVATVLWRMEGSPAQEGDDPFTDTESGAWYSDGITWAAEAGIAEGYGGGLFGPNDPVTREQLAAFFYRYAEYRDYDLSPTDDLSGFTDADSVSEWAQEAMKWAIGSGLIAGRDDKRIDPQATATRAEFAAMLHRFIEKYGLEEKTTYTGLMGWVDPNSDYMKSPKTGDGATATAGWISLFAAGTAGAGYAAYKLRRRKKDNLKPPTPTPA